MNNWVIFSVFCYIHFANRVQKYYFLRTYANNFIKNLHFLHISSIFTQPNLRMCDFCSTFAPDL